MAVHCSGNTKDDGVLGRDAGGPELQQDEEEQEPHHRNTRMQCRAADYITDSSCYSGRSTPPISCIYILLHSSPGPTPVLRYKTPLSRFHIDGEFVRVLVLGLSSCTSHKAIFLDFLWIRHFMTLLTESCTVCLFSLRFKFDQKHFWISSYLLCWIQFLQV